jgi:hypothetical protein
VSVSGKSRLGCLAGTGLLVLLLGTPFWYWCIERTEVQPGEFLVRIHLWGKDLPENEIVAPDETFKGVMLDVLPEGRHFINPLFWTYERHQITSVPPGKCLVLTRKYGTEIPKERLQEGDYLARDGERGIVRDVLPPGSYRLNPHAYSWESVDAVEIHSDQVGARTLKVGRDPRGLKDRLALGEGLYVVEEGYRGVQEKPVRNGTYYLNPHVEAITPIDVKSHKVEFDDITFPSRDGFLLKPHVVVEYAVQPEQAPALLVRLCDEGKLYQEDATEAQQLKNEILQKVILPHIRGYSRLKGSDFDAKDFIVTTAGNVKAVNNREKLQKALFEEVAPKCLKLGIVVRSVTLAELKPPEELARQIADRELARVEREKNAVRLGQYKAEQSLKAKEALKQQAKEKVEAETRLVRETTRAEQLIEVETARLEQELKNAQLKLEAARDQAKAVRAKGEAEAKVMQLQNEAEVAGLRKAVQGFASVQNFAQYHVISRLAPALAEIFASDDSDLAKLLTNYLSPPATMNKPTADNGEKPMPTTAGK